MSAKLNLTAFRAARSCVLLYRTLLDVPLAELDLETLVRLRAITRAKIAADRFETVPEELLTLYNGMLCHRPLPLTPKAPGDMGHFTVLHPSAGIPNHLRSVTTYIAFLAASETIQRIDVVVSCEYNPRLWDDTERHAKRQIITQTLTQALHKLHGPADAQRFGEKLNIILAPNAQELTDAIGDVVIRYEGSVPPLQYRLCMQAIHRARPVVAIPGTAVISHAPLVDMLATPARRSYGADECHYLRPLPPFPTGEALDRVIPPCDTRRVLLTGYSQNKLARGLAALGDADWQGLSAVLAADPALSWHLFGAADVTEARNAMPAAFLDQFGPRIQISGMLDLADIWRDGFAFLALPGVGGGATVAKDALHNGIPVLVVRNGNHDISNMFPTLEPDTRFAQLLGRITDWHHTPAARRDFLHAQITDINARADYPAKHAELRAILRDVAKRFEKRRVD